MKLVAGLMIVAGFIASLKVALTAWLVATPVTPLGVGTVEITVGAVGAGTVRKFQAKLLAMGSPCVSKAPVVIVAVYKVLVASGLDGVKIATKPLPVQLTVPVTEPTGAGAATVNVVVERVEQLIALLNVALMGWLSRTPVALGDGIVETTVGSVSVVNVHE